MAHKHSVYDTDTHFSIDPITRAIKNEGSTKAILMQNDHNAERFTFELPRHVDGHDMSLCNRVEVHYNNIEKQTLTQNKSVYECTDFSVASDDEDVVICSWLISGEATKYEGSLNFCLRFACLTDETIDYQWFSDIFKGISVSKGIYNTEYVAEEYADILAQWKAEIDEALAQGGSGHTHENEDILDKFSEHPERSDLLQYDETIVWTSQNGGVVNLFETNNKGDLTLGVKSNYGVILRHTIKAPPTKTSQLENDSGFVDAEKLKETDAIHTHDNKDVLDTITQETLDNIGKCGDLTPEQWQMLGSMAYSKAGRLIFSGDQVRMCGDGYTISQIEELEGEIRLTLAGGYDDTTHALEESYLTIPLVKGKIETEKSTIMIDPNVHYSFGVVSELRIGFGIGSDDKCNEYSFTFISGTTPTVLTLPDTVKWANELTIEANKRYEVSIVDNIGLWCAVEVSV